MLKKETNTQVTSQSEIKDDVLRELSYETSK